jgi:Tfp pilus assembly protein PilF
VEFRKALKAWPRDSDTAWAIADCYSELLKPKLAEKFYRLALGTCAVKKRALLLYNIGNALFDQKKYKDALTQYERISKQNRVYKQARKNIKLAKSKITK